MATVHPVPKDKEVRQMLGMLYADGFGVDPGEPVATDSGSNSIVAVYINDEGTPVTACCCDLPFAAYSGAALSMIPAGGAEDAAKSGDLTEMMRGNLHEIMNICSRLFMTNETPHLKLEALYDSPDALPESARSMVDAAPGRSDYRVKIPGYGEGNISFLST
jgi:hypothetical protein